MSLQNRVTPLGNLIAVADRGLMFGNRGVLHDSKRRIVRYNRGRRWIVCELEFRGRHRPIIMRPGHYTELFFLDEATAIAAGHRPCAECRHREYQHFRRCWAAASGEPGILPSADDLDAQLHLDRLAVPGVRKTYRDEITALPDGVFVLIDGEAWLIRQEELLHWTPGGYDQRRARPNGGQVTVLTPRGTTRAIAAGYLPGIHPSAYR